MSIALPVPGDSWRRLSPRDEDMYVRAMLGPDAHLAEDPAVRRHILGRFYAALLLGQNDAEFPPEPSMSHTPSLNS